MKSKISKEISENRNFVELICLQYASNCVRSFYAQKYRAQSKRWNQRFGKGKLVWMFQWKNCDHRNRSYAVKILIFKESPQITHLFFLNPFSRCLLYGYKRLVKRLFNIFQSLLDKISVIEFLQVIQLNFQHHYLVLSPWTQKDSLTLWSKDVDTLRAWSERLSTVIKTILSSSPSHQLASYGLAVIVSLASSGKTGLLFFSNNFLSFMLVARTALTQLLFSHIIRRRAPLKWKGTTKHNFVTTTRLNFMKCFCKLSAISCAFIFECIFSRWVWITKPLLRYTYRT